MAQEDPTEKLWALHEQIDEMTASLLQARQDVSRLQRKVDLLRRVPAGLTDRIDPALLERLLEAEGAQAAEQTARDFPEYFREVVRKAKKQSPR